MTTLHQFSVVSMMFGHGDKEKINRNRLVEGSECCYIAMMFQEMYDLKTGTLCLEACPTPLPIHFKVQSKRSPKKKKKKSPPNGNDGNQNGGKLQDLSALKVEEEARSVFLNLVRLKVLLVTCQLLAFIYSSDYGKPTRETPLL